ncbi:MAG TPA: energy transducer TonB [Chryseolinea sp.]
MKKVVLTVSFLMTLVICNAQTSETKYYKSTSRGEEEVSQDKAKYSRTITQNQDGSVTTTRTNLKKNIVEHSETLKGEEPFGIWIYLRGNGPAEMDYNFDLVYSQEECPKENVVPNIDDYFVDHPEQSYVAPKLPADEESLARFVGRNLVYPAKARRGGIQGVVWVTFTITKQGNTENVYVNKGVHLVLDKEAARVVRKLKFSRPPMVNGQPADVCITLPIKFKLA